MNPSASIRPFWFRVAGLSVLLGLVASGFSPPILFELIGRDHRRWVERFSTGQEEALVRVEDGQGSLPYILPGPADDWAGGRPHRIQIHFVGPRQDHVLRVTVADFHHDSPPVLRVSVDGQDVGRVWASEGATGLRREHLLEMPAAVLHPNGAQTLTITNSKGSWVTLSRLQVLASFPTFSLSHYLDRSPPPRWGLVTLGIGLLALWAADRRRVRERVFSLLLLAAGLTLLALLGIARGKALPMIPRAIWLLLAVGFSAALAPTLPRLALPRLLNLTAFATGAIVMVLEMVGFRLLSPYFGYSIYVWGSLLGVIMGALAIGYYLGGWLADRWPLTALYQSLLATAFLILAALYAYPFIIRLSVNLPLVSGSLLATLLLVLLPMVGLSLTPPFVIRALAASGRVGVTAGRIYAISTAGSIVGTFASAFVLITGLGPQASWVLSGLLLLFLSAYGLSLEGGRGGILAAQALGVLLVFAQPWIPEISVASLKGGMRIYATESEYSHLEVIEVGKTLQLVPQLHFTHTIYDEERVFEPVIVNGLLPSFLTEPRRFLHLGMGGGALVRLYLHVYPQIEIDGVDIDREMIRLGQRFLGLREDPRLRIFIEDGRAFLLRGPRTRYDVLVVDLFQGGVFVPYYTLTREFFELGRDRLNEGGVLAIFVARPRPFDSPLRREKFDRLFKSIGNTLAAVFPSVFFYSVSEIGYYFAATTEPTSLEAVRARLGRVAIPEITEPLGAAVKRIREYEPDPRIRVLTDDLAPVDQLIYDAFFRH